MIYQIENNNYITSDLFSVCKCIYSKLEDFKNYISKLLINNNSHMGEYSVYYNALFDILGLFDDFKIEYRCLLKTNRLIEYVFKNKTLTPELKEFVQSVWKSFTNLLKFRLNMLESNDVYSDDYDIVCSKFSDELDLHRDYFYGEIYIRTDEFGDEINEIKSILF